MSVSACTPFTMVVPASRPMTTLKPVLVTVETVEVVPVVADLITKPKAAVQAAVQAGKGTGTTTTNGQGAPAGQGKADQAKTLPQTGNEQGSLLAASGLGMLLLGLLGLGGKRKKED